MDRESPDADILSVDCEIDGEPTLLCHNIDSSYPTISDNDKSSTSGKRKATSDSSSSSSDSSDPEKSPEQSDDESTKAPSPAEQVESESESESERLSREGQVVADLENLFLCDPLDDDKHIQRDSEGDTILHLLFICLNFSCIRQMLKSRSISRYMRVQNNLFQTALHLAVNSEVNAPIDIIHGLFQAGADPKIQDIFGRTFLHIICENSDHQTLSDLCFKKTDVTYGCKQVQENICQCVNMQNYDGLTALQIAVIRGSNAVVMTLLSLGVDVNIRDRKSGRTALHFAAEEGFLDIVKTLINYSDVDIEKKTYNQESALILAYHRKHDSIVRYLQENGAKCILHEVKAFGSIRRKFLKTKESQFQV